MYVKTDAAKNVVYSIDKIIISYCTSYSEIVSALFKPETTATQIVTQLIK